jgi:ribose/xylose/arabinose/galactoside ABC-type transport system permease subunit
MEANYDVNILRNAHNRKLLIARKGDVIFIFIFLAILIIVSSFLDENFLSLYNMKNLVRVWAPVMVATYAQSMIMISMAGVDLSISGIVSLTNCVLATTMTDTFAGWFFPVLLCLGLGLGIGWVNGMLVAKGGQQPIIITLATNTFLLGMSLFILLTPGGHINVGFSKLIMSGLGGGVSVIILAVVTVAVWIMLNRTRFGRQCFAVGGNANAAYSSGIKVNRIKIYAFMTSGVLSAIAGIMLSAIMSSGAAHSGDEYAMRTITAAVVGGVSLLGGRGGIIGCIAGVFIVAIINNILNLVGVSSYYQYVFQGGILLVALAFAAIRETRKS